MSDDVRAQIRADAARSRAQLDALTREFDAVVAATDASPPDDEHDPDGATVGFERAQLAALIATTRRHLHDLDAARRRLDAGEYGNCERCHGPIALDRLLALPATTLCVACATRNTDARSRRASP